MNVSRGDVVLVDYPYSDRTGSKVRPCLVVQNDQNNRRLDDTIVVMFSSRTQYSSSEPTQLLITANSRDGQQAGLLFDSAVLCENIATVDRSFVRRRIGTVPDATLRNVDECLKASLGIL